MTVVFRKVTICQSSTELMFCLFSKYENPEICWTNCFLMLSMKEETKIVIRQLRMEEKRRSFKDVKVFKGV